MGGHPKFAGFGHRKGGKGSSKRGGNRLRTALRDNIRGMSKQVIRSQARRYCVKCISYLIYEETLVVVKVFAWKRYQRCRLLHQTCKETMTKALRILIHTRWQSYSNWSNWFNKLQRNLSDRSFKFTRIFWSHYRNQQKRRRKMVSTFDEYFDQLMTESKSFGSWKHPKKSIGALLAINIARSICKQRNVQTWTWRFGCF